MVLRGFLKFLGALLLVGLILAFVLGVAAYFTFRNLDPNMFRAEFEKQLTVQTGFRTELGEIHLRWKPQPQLQIDGLKFYHPQTLEKLLQSGELRVDADLSSIMRKHFRISQVLIRDPEVFVRRDPKGVLNWLSVSRPATVTATPRPSSGLIPVAEAAEAPETISLNNLDRIGQGWEFGIGKIQVKNASVHFTDETVQPALVIEADRIDAEILQRMPAAVFHFSADASLFGAPGKNLDCDGDLDLEQQSLDLRFHYNSSQISSKGLLKVLKAKPHFEGTLDVRDLDILSVTPEAYKKGEHLTGRLTTQAQISFDGLTPEAIKRSLRGMGTATIKDGALRNRNLVKEVFDRMSSVIAITNSLGGELPPEIYAMLKDRDTPFQSLKIACNVQDSNVTLSDFQLLHPSYDLAGLGTYGLITERADGSMRLLLSKSISGFFLAK